MLPRFTAPPSYTRGQTQVMSITTLGATGDVQELDTTGIEETKRYLHHYNFPPYSVGETRPLRGPGRREIATAALLKGRCFRFRRTRTTSPTPCVMFRKCLSPTGRRPWLRSAAAPLSR